MFVAANFCHQLICVCVGVLRARYSAAPQVVEGGICRWTHTRLCGRGMWARTPPAALKTTSQHLYNVFSKSVGGSARLRDSLVEC